MTVTQHFATPSQKLRLQPSLVPALDALADWRLALESKLSQLESLLARSELLAPNMVASLGALRRRLTNDKLVVAFVAEFSRGKSELINAIFFADSGRRILPATPGRTTMCPVELSWDADELPSLDLLSIDTRLEEGALADWIEQRDRWRRIALDPNDAEALALALNKVTETRLVSQAEAMALNLWSEEHTADNPPITAEGLVEVPAWRHAIINYPHPLLQRGLVVVDTPGLNAIGAEPELTLGLLPSAHAALFVLGADTGVTRSDLDIWNDHLGGQGLACFVVLNKMDTLADPLLSPAEQAQSIERQRSLTAQTLGISPQKVFPLSARQALAARLQGDEEALIASRLPLLEAALNSDLLPRRQEVLGRTVIAGVHSLMEHANRRLRDQRRQNAEQMLELRGLRGKSAARVAHMIDRAQADSDEFERCGSRLSALRAVHARLLKQSLEALSADRIRICVKELQKSMGAGWFNLRARAAFSKLCADLQAQIDASTALCNEAAQMLLALFNQLNAEFGFSLGLPPPLNLAVFKQDLAAIERSYSQYFSVTRSLRLNSEAYSEQFQRMLVAKLRVVFETASGEVESWNQAASGQIDSQFRERRRSFKRRRESLERIQGATGELEIRLQEVETQDARLLELADQAEAIAAAICHRAESGAGFDLSQHRMFGDGALPAGDMQMSASPVGLQRTGRAA
jgi:hypothetical protein